MKMTYTVLVSISILMFTLMPISCDTNIGVLYAEDENGANNSHCIMYSPKFEPLPTKLHEAMKLPVANLSNLFMCNDTLDTKDYPPVEGKAAFVKRGNCTFSEKARVVQKLGARALIVVSYQGLVEPEAETPNDYEEIHIPIALLTNTDFESLMSLGKPIQVQMYAPPNSRLDFVVMWILATGTVFAGAFWSGIARHRQYAQKKRSSSRRRESDHKSDEDDGSREEDTLDLSPKAILIFVCLMCTMLICLYFFYDYLVYVVISMFTLASSIALFGCLRPLVLQMTCISDCQVPPNRIPFLKHRPEFRMIVLYLMCAGVAVFWAVVRNENYAWILQDFLGIMFCIYMLKTLRLPNLQACCILLVLLFFYDIFFVFITPLFTKTGRSIMVDVATGGQSSSGEMLPMVLKIPKITLSDLSLCPLTDSLLGFGDMLVPGLLVSYCHSFDLKVRSKRIYFLSTVGAYGVGLILTFLALLFMEKGQPALLYLVPCTLLTCVIIGACRRELRHLWTGKLVKKVSESEPQPPTADVNGSDTGEATAINNSPLDDSDSERPLLDDK